MHSTNKGPVTFGFYFNCKIKIVVFIVTKFIKFSSPTIFSPKPPLPIEVPKTNSDFITNPVSICLLV